MPIALVWGIPAIVCALAPALHAQTPPPVKTCTLSCEDAKATGQFSTALGFNTSASGLHSTALGDSCAASGKSSTALGHHTSASQYSTSMGCELPVVVRGRDPGGVHLSLITVAPGVLADKTTAANTGTAFGYFTQATGEYSTVFGNYIGTAEKESLAVSGKVHASNVHLFADDRLAANVVIVNNRSSMLAGVRALELVEYGPSASLCAHRGIDARACSDGGLRTVGLLASSVADAMPDALSTTDVSLHLTDYKDGSSASQTSPRVAEDVEQIRSLDVAALLANLVGSIQVRRKMSG